MPHLATDLLLLGRSPTTGRLRNRAALEKGLRAALFVELIEAGRIGDSANSPLALTADHDVELLARRDRQRHLGVSTQTADIRAAALREGPVTAGRWASVHNADAGVTLATPDAPLVQIGDFGFGRPQGFAKERARPLLLSWPVNNYWVTNFPASQPGPNRPRARANTNPAANPTAATPTVSA